MNKQVITDEILREFICNRFPDDSESILDGWEKYIASHQPPQQEWEVVLHRHKGNGTIELYAEAFLHHPYFDIYSVRRIYDSAELQVGKAYEIELGDGKTFRGIVTSFNGISLVYFMSASFALKCIKSFKECEEVLFTTQDGKEIHEGDDFWCVSPTNTAIALIAHTGHIEKFVSTYSTKEIAEQHICNLSLEMIREALEGERGDYSHYPKHVIGEIMEDIERGLSQLKSKDHV